MKKLPAKINNLVGRAMHTYDMLADQDRIMIAVSGGIDSLVLVWILDYWRRKAPIHYELLAVHLDMGFGSNEAQLVETELKRLGIQYYIEKTTYGKEALKAEEGKSGCFHCARKRRNRLFDLALEKNCGKIAFGHHKEDIIETFFLNLFYSGNISAMVPRQNLFDGNLAIIRPLAYLEKIQIRELGNRLSISPVANPCPLTGQTQREKIRTILADLCDQSPKIKANIFHALGNIKMDYLLKHENPS